MIKYVCTKCAAELESPVSMAGRTERCPVCGRVNVVPHPARRGRPIGLIVAVAAVVLAAAIAAALLLLLPGKEEEDDFLRSILSETQSADAQPLSRAPEVQPAPIEPPRPAAPERPKVPWSHQPLVISPTAPAPERPPEAPPQQAGQPGGRIAFASNRDGQGPDSYDIYVMDADGSNVKRITFIGGTCPAWSPDGRKLAFDNRGEIHIVNWDGSSATGLRGCKGTNPVWSRDGARIVFERRFALIAANPDGTEEVRLTDGSGNDFDPCWHPDGMRILHSSRPASGGPEGPGGHASAGKALRQLFLTRLDGGKPQPLSGQGSGLEFCSPRYSPDGRKIVAAGGKSWSSPEDIYVMDADGGNPVNLTRTHTPRNAYPCWSPDGKWIAFCSTRDGKGPYDYQIFVIAAELPPSPGRAGQAGGSGLRRISDGKARDMFPAWQP